MFDALRRRPPIFPQLEELDARFNFSKSDLDELRLVFQDLVRVRKAVINKIYVSPVLGSEFIEFLHANINHVVIAQPSL